jgi:hypothetical protein
MTQTIEKQSLGLMCYRKLENGLENFSQTDGELIAFSGFFKFRGRSWFYPGLP